LISELLGPRAVEERLLAASGYGKCEGHAVEGVVYLADFGFSDRSLKSLYGNTATKQELPSDKHHSIHKIVYITNISIYYHIHDIDVGVFRAPAKRLRG
jgi:hypothetical protein